MKGGLPPRWMRRTFLVGVVLVIAGSGAHNHVEGLKLMLVGGVLLTFVVAIWRQGRTGSAGTVRRMSTRSRRRHGVASWWVVLRHASRFAVRRKMLILRPSLRNLSFFARMRVPTREIATPLAKVGLLTVWSPIEDVTLRIGGPRVGKTGELACRILDAPGAVIATSTRTDLIELTAPLRSQVGPVWVFNPSDLGRQASSVVFDPLAGCEDPKTAAHRATDLIAGSAGASSGGSGEREFWQAQAVRVLSAMLHAAAVGRMSMRDVQRWVAAPRAHAEVMNESLRGSPHDAIKTDLDQFIDTNERTQTSIAATIMPALGWLNDSTAATAAGQDCTPALLAIDSGLGAGYPTDAMADGSAGTGSSVAALAGSARAGFDVAQLLAQRGTVYMLGAEDAQVAPLVCALTGHIARTARQLASELTGGRLDPPLTLALDEAALICPIPLDSWTADMGGRNVTIHIAVQSRAQIRQRWGDVGAAAIMNNAATLLIFGGTRDVDDLTAYETLTGDRHEQIATYGQHGAVISRTPQTVPVLSAAQFAQLPPGQVVIISRGMPPAFGRVQMAWKRPDVRQVVRLARRRLRAEKRVAARMERSLMWASYRAAIKAGAKRLAAQTVKFAWVIAETVELARQSWPGHAAEPVVDEPGETEHAGAADRGGHDA
jgi:type IV secretion system protein VirD4